MCNNIHAHVQFEFQFLNLRSNITNKLIKIKERKVNVPKFTKLWLVLLIYLCMCITTNKL